MLAGIRDRLPRFVERLLLVVGFILLAGVAAAIVDRTLSSRRALNAFDRGQAALLHASAALGTSAEEAVDFSLWSEKRVRAYRESLLAVTDAPMAVITIEKLKIRAPVFEGTDDLILNRGVGWIEGTARPGDPGNGNIGMAGHRDGFFRQVKDIAVGDEVELATLGVIRLYAVDSIEIVAPADVGVLDPRGSPSLTLVTCYPFYFVGDAPQRFIVHATLKRQVNAGRF